MAEGPGPFLQVLGFSPATTYHIETINFKPPLETCSISFDYQHSATLTGFFLTMSVNDQRPTLLWSNTAKRGDEGNWYSTAVDIGKVHNQFKLTFELRTSWGMSRDEFVGIKNVQFDTNCFVPAMIKVCLYHDIQPSQLILYYDRALNVTHMMSSNVGTENVYQRRNSVMRWTNAAMVLMSPT